MPRGRWISTLLTPLGYGCSRSFFQFRWARRGRARPFGLRARAPSDESILGFAFHPTIGSSAPPTPTQLGCGGGTIARVTAPFQFLRLAGRGVGVRGLCTSSVLASSSELAEALLTRNER